MLTKYVNGVLCFMQEDGLPAMIVPDEMRPFLEPEREIHPLIFMTLLVQMDLSSVLEDECEMEFLRRV